MAKKEAVLDTPAPVWQSFVQKVREVLPKGLSLADEIAAILDCSVDSAYRRIRGETSFTIEEVYIICKKYGVSMDEVFSNRSDTVTFTYTKLTDSAQNFQAYLNRLVGHLTAISKSANKKIHYVAAETPLFYSFYSEKFTAFKLFYWQRSVLNVEEYQNKKFDWNAVPREMVIAAHNSYREYMNVPSMEVWTNETILTGLKQMKYYFESGVITRDIALELLAEFRGMVNMVYQNAVAGKKNPADEAETFQMYHSEVVLGTNCIYIQMGDNRFSYISFNTLNSLTTSNPEFCEETEHWIKNAERKSTLISGAGEKQRNRFFSDMNAQIDLYVEDISNART